MLNFDLKKSIIYPAIEWEPFFKLAKPIKKIFAVLSIIFFILFSYGFLANGFSYDLSKAFLGLLMISVAIYVAAVLKNAFFELKIKNPSLKASIKDLIANPERYNMADFLSFESAKAIDKAIRSSRGIEITSTHLFYSFLRDDPRLNFIFTRLLLDKKNVEESIKKYLGNLPSSRETSALSDSFKNTIVEALNIANRKDHLRVESGDVITSLSLSDPIFKRILIEFDLKADDVENLNQWLESIETEVRNNKRFWERENLARRGTLAKAWTSGYTITLDKYSIDWTEALRKNLPHVIGHEKELKMIERILSGGGRNSLLLIGEPGVGEKRIVFALTKKSILGQSLEEINYKRIVELDMPSLLAEIEDVEQVELIMDKIFQEAVSAGNVILIIDNFHNYVGQSGKPGMIDISGIIASYIKYPQCQLIGITTYDGLHENIEKDSSFASLFERVEVSELSRDETLLFLEGLIPELERKYELIVSYPSLREIVLLSERYMPNLAFPEKAVKVLEDVVVYVADLKDGKIVLPKHVAKIITEKTEIPVGEIEEKEKEILLNLEGLIHKRIVNQSEAVKEVSEAMRRARSEVTIRKGPIGAFIFLGPTGVGKTETSKALAEVYFGNEERMLRFDMSEFQDVKDIPRLIGSKDQPGLLTTAVRENPFSVLLLDEIEKADFNVRNLFLQILDEGYVNDNLGKKVDFKNTIIIATSNAGYKVILQALRKRTPWDEVKKELVDYLFEERMFQPEFLNRFDAVVVFHPLSRENILEIAGLMLIKLQKNLTEKGIELVISDALKEKIADLGYNEVFGAREMRRVIQEKIENVLAPAIISGKLKRGNKVEINPMNFELIINSSF